VAHEHRIGRLHHTPGDLQPIGRTLMRAAIQTGLRTIEVRDLPEPVPDAETALVGVRAVGICGSDLHTYHDRAEPQTLPNGHEVAGEVLRLPPGYGGPARVGDLVAVDTICLGLACGTCPICRAGQPFHCLARRTAPPWGGGFAEVIKRRPAGLFPLPPGLTPEQGALVEPLAVGVHTVRWARMAAGANVVILGAGTIGLTTLIAARALGAGAVHVVARHAHQAALASALGAARVLPDEPAAALERVRDLTGGLGADLVVETVGGHGDTINLAWELTRPQGTVAIVGVFPERVPVDLLRPLMREVWVTFPACYGVIDGRHDFAVAIDLIASGRAPVERLVTSRFPLTEAPAAFQTAADKATGSVKIHLTAEGPSTAAEPAG
jgi:threonine dehydrogenase-like Zn-dependent dehydrogenase